MGNQKQFIGVTGGPGGGKTTALDLFQRELKSAVEIVPEAATLLFGHGLDRDTGSNNAKTLQRSIYRMQISLEEIFQEFYPDRLLICDRGPSMHLHAGQATSGATLRVFSRICG